TALALDPRDGRAGGPPDVSWCSGLAGTVAAAATVCRASADRQVEALATRPLLRDLSLCHGELGAIEPLVLLASQGHEVAAAAVRRRAGLLLGAIGQIGTVTGAPGGVPTPGLLTGLSGIGYGLLRLGHPGLVPSVLLLEPHPSAESERPR
ncbi:MAG TPA: lanthionine synthetase LanC family protein, partial [Pseudonocardiaceae bacterium]